ncbi:hypothetical protein [Phenylobacterium sp.]|uniref:hypothetical protein n=1 Tax=Phenylobacterium sp. TaxID=1871053 RepID=UPI00286C1C5E|nr:hypothetical protein [Phenylobacterium sp.]
MKIIELNAADCTTTKVFTALLKDAIQALPGHGTSIPAFVDSMIWGTGVSDLVPPYTIRVVGRLDREVGRFARELSDALEAARTDRRTRKGEDVAVVLETGRR